MYLGVSQASHPKRAVRLNTAVHRSIPQSTSACRQQKRTKIGPTRESSWKDSISAETRRLLLFGTLAAIFGRTAVKCGRLGWTAVNTAE